MKELAPLVVPLEAKFASDGAFYTMGATYLAKIGESKLGLIWAQKGYQLDANFASALALAMNHSKQENWNEALKWYWITFSHENEGCSALLDAGDLAIYLKRFPEAIKAYCTALERVPDHPWATPSLMYAKMELGDAESEIWRERLLIYAESNPDNSRAQTLLVQASPWVLYLPGPSDATAKMIPQIESGVSINSIGVSSIESPSVYVAVRLALRRQNKDTNFEVQVGKIPEPDPRESTADKIYAVWTYREGFWSLGNHAKTTLTPPSPEVMKAVEQIASSNYSLVDWCQAGYELAPRIGLDKIHQLLGAMVHPSLPPKGCGAEVWVLRLQFAVCCILAQLDKGWKNSIRRRVLLSLLHEPMDWINTAAVIVLSQLALELPEARDEIKAELVDKLDRIPRLGYCPYAKALCSALLRLPNLNDNEREPILKWRRELD